MMNQSIIDMPSDLDFQRFEGEQGFQPQRVPEPQKPSNLMDETETDAVPPKQAFWQLDFYKKFFDVDTDEVVDRIYYSFLPFGNFLQNNIKSKPDLYGPVWICITLVFSTAISGNISDYFHTSLGSSYHWKYDFHTVTTVATVIFLYAWLYPCCIWALLRWYGPEMEKISLIETITLFGYCLFIFVPLSALWLVPKLWFQWIVTIVGASASGIVLTKSLFPFFSKKMYPLLVAILFIHIYVAAMFMQKFKVSSTSHEETTVAPLILSTAASAVTSGS